MPSEDTGDQVTPTDGPNLLEERSVGGIFVHFLAIPTGIVGAGIVYLLATNEFTKRNARNALDWHLTVLALTVVTFGSLFTFAELSGQGVTSVVTLPSVAMSAGSFVVPALLTVWFVVGLWTFVVGLIATGKATFGTAWRYPFSPALVERYGSRVDFADRWPLIILAYVVFAPLVFWTVFIGTTGTAVFFISAFGMIGLIMLLAPLTGVAMFLHGERHRLPDANWQPHVVAYLGLPVISAIVGYAFSETFTDSINPAGDAMYVLLACLWVSSFVYVIRWLTTSK